MIEFFRYTQSDTMAFLAFYGLLAVFIWIVIYSSTDRARSETRKVLRKQKKDVFYCFVDKQQKHLAFIVVIGNFGEKVNFINIRSDNEINPILFKVLEYMAYRKVRKNIFYFLYPIIEMDIINKEARKKHE